MTTANGPTKSYTDADTQISLKKTAAIVAATTGLLLVGVFATKAVSNDSPPPAAATGHTEQELRYLSVLEASDIQAPTADKAIAGGRSICFMFDRQATRDQIIYGLMDNSNVEFKKARMLVEAATTYLCPEYTS